MNPQWNDQLFSEGQKSLQRKANRLPFWQMSMIFLLKKLQALIISNLYLLYFKYLDIPVLNYIFLWYILYRKHLQREGAF